MLQGYVDSTPRGLKGQRRFHSGAAVVLFAPTALSPSSARDFKAMESVLPPLIYTGKAMAGVAVGDAMPVSRPLWEPTQAP
jgi:hypothetical protein